MAMELSLGVLGDLMWSRLPETRPLLARLIIDEVESAEAAGRELRQLEPGDLVPDALWLPVMRPTFQRYPADRGKLVDQLQVVFEAYQDDGPRRDPIRYFLWHYLLHHLQDPPYKEIVAELHPELAALVAQAVSD